MNHVTEKNQYKKLKVLQERYEENFTILMCHVSKKDDVYFNALHKENHLEKETTRIKRQLGILAKDPCAGAPCHMCLYRLSKDHRRACDVERNIRENQGVFKGFSPKEGYAEWKEHRRKTENKYNTANRLHSRERYAKVKAFKEDQKAS